MRGKVLLERNRRTLIEQDSHFDRVSGGLNAARRVLEDSFNLLALDPWKPFQELIDCRAAFDILEQRAYRYARAAKDPRAAYLLRITLHGRAGAPIKHRYTLLSTQAKGKQQGGRRKDEGLL